MKNKKGFDKDKGIKEEGNGLSRRDFLKISGFSLTAAAMALSGCEQAINKAIPFLFKPEGHLPGMPIHFASTYFDGNDYSSILVKTREGRPVKIDANPASVLSGKGTNARIQASVLSLYDNNRLKHPLKNKKKTSWEIADKEIIEKLENAKKNKEKIAILSSTIISPSTKKILKEFSDYYPETEIIFL